MVQRGLAGGSACPTKTKSISNPEIISKLETVVYLSAHVIILKLSDSLLLIPYAADGS
jgi:hypothetical protein